MSTADVLNGFFRTGILQATSNPVVRNVVDRYGMQLGASRFVAGETLDEAVAALHELEGHGLRTNTSLLGEHVHDEDDAREVSETYIQILDRLKAEGLQTNIAVKLTHLGLDLGEEIAYRNVEPLVVHAAELNNTVRIDMEESGRVDSTLSIYRRLRDAGYSNVGTVLQSYLYRSEQDLIDLLQYEPNLRLVKGAYLEPPDVAYPEKRDVDVNYLRLAKRMLAYGGYTAIATHDERIIEYVIEYTSRNGIARDCFEFQMLYGIRPDLQLDLVKRGFTVLISTNYGSDWYPYLMRRLAERPANLLFVAKNMVR